MREIGFAAQQRPDRVGQAPHFGLGASSLDTNLARFDSELTLRPGHGTELARQAVKAGWPIVAAVGGDGTISEVANGFFEDGAPIPTRSRLAALTTGTGGDFRRTFGIPTEPERAAAMLRAGRSRRIDAGRVTCTLAGGETTVRYLVNVADAGIGQEVLARVTKLGLRTRRGMALSPQSFGQMMRNSIYIGRIESPEYGVSTRRDFDPLVSERTSYRAQAILDGRVQVAGPRERNHPDFPLRGFVGCEACGRPLTGSWSKGRNGYYA